jgi:DNA-binding beta-propeller fold protein YncE
VALVATVGVAIWAVARAQDGGGPKEAARRILALRSSAPREAGASVVRIDPATNKVVAAIAAPPDQIGLAVGKAAIWVATNHEYGLIGIDPTSDSTLPAAPQVPGRVEGLAVAGATVAVVTEPPRAALTVLGPRCLFPSTGYCTTLLRQRRGTRYTSRWLTPRLASDGRAIWVADPTRSTVGRIDRNHLKIVDTVRIQTLVQRHRMELDGLAVGAGGVWVTGAALRTIVHRSSGVTYFEEVPVAAYLWRVDPSTRRVVARIRLPRPADSIAVGAGAVWITGGGRPAIWRIDPARNRIDGRIDVGGTASGIAVGYGSLWVGDPQLGVVSRVDAKTHRVLQTIQVGRDPQQIAIGFGAVWVTQWDVRPWVPGRRVR